MTNYNKMHNKPQETEEVVEEIQPVEPEITPEVVKTRNGITTAYLNVRSTMSTDSDIVEVLPVKTKIRILGVEGDWYQVSHDEKFGYVLSEFIETEN